MPIETKLGENALSDYYLRHCVFVDQCCMDNFFVHEKRWVKVTLALPPILQLGVWGSVSHFVRWSNWEFYPIQSRLYKDIFLPLYLRTLKFLGLDNFLSIVLHLMSQIRRSHEMRNRPWRRGLFLSTKLRVHGFLRHNHLPLTKSWETVAEYSKNLFYYTPGYQSDTEKIYPINDTDIPRKNYRYIDNQYRYR